MSDKATSGLIDRQSSRWAAQNRHSKPEEPQKAKEVTS